MPKTIQVPDYTPSERQTLFHTTTADEAGLLVTSSTANDNARLIIVQFTGTDCAVASNEFAGIAIIRASNGNNLTRGFTRTDLGQFQGNSPSMVALFSEATEAEEWLLSSTSPQIESGYNISYSTQYNTRFTKITPTTGGSDVVFSASYYIDPTEATTTQSDKNPTAIRVQYSLRPENSFSAVSNPITVSVSPTWEYGTTSFTFPDFASNSTYDLTISFANAGTPITGVTPFPLAYAYMTIVTNGSVGI